MINCGVEYYDRQGDYAPRKWDKPMLHDDSPVKMVTFPDTAMIIPGWPMIIQPILLLVSLERAGEATSPSLEGAGGKTLVLLEGARISLELDLREQEEGGDDSEHTREGSESESRHTEIEALSPPTRETTNTKISSSRFPNEFSSWRGSSTKMFLMKKRVIVILT